eukprot:g26494.t1
MNEILSNDKVAAYFQTLDLDVHEGAALFHLLDNGDGEVTLDEFIDGIMRCKGPARAIDQVAMHADLKQLDIKLAKMARYFNHFDLSPRSKKDRSKKERSSVHRISLGPDMLLGSHCIVLVHHYLDRYLHTCPTKLFEVPAEVAKSRRQRQARLKRT